MRYKTKRQIYYADLIIMYARKYLLAEACCIYDARHHDAVRIYRKRKDAIDILDMIGAKKVHIAYPHLACNK